MDNFQVLDLNNLMNGLVIYKMRSPREEKFSRERSESEFWMC